MKILMELEVDVDKEEIADEQKKLGLVSQLQMAVNGEIYFGESNNDDCVRPLHVMQVHFIDKP